MSHLTRGRGQRGCRSALYRYLTGRIAGLDGVTAVEVATVIRTVKRAATVVPAG